MSRDADPGLLAVAGAARRCTTTDAEGVVTAWRSWRGAAGDASAALVLIHGSFGSWTHWARNVHALSRHCTVVCPDVPGFGDSGDAPAQRAPDAIGRALARGLLAWRAQAGVPVRRWFVGGFSLGAVYAGWLARALVDLHGEPVQRMVLVSPGGLGARDERELGLRRVRGDADAAERRDTHRHNLATVMFGDARRIDETAIRVQADNVARARYRGPFAPSPDFLLRALADTSWPLLGLWGDRDAFDLDVRVRCESLRRVRPDAVTEVFPGYGHWLPYENATTINSTIAAWLAAGS